MTLCLRDVRHSSRLHIIIFVRYCISSLRSKLHKLKINNARVLDVHYPDRQVVALLVHTEYTADLLAAFAKAKVEPIQGFNPWNPDLLRDPKYANLPESDRAAKSHP
ncbi:hypothetical protein G6F44_013444 [Rhizopus delemar]|nr:hypothetical protein G6F44_013444 [Rhizopus delemar]